MHTTHLGTPFIVIGEDIHATRAVRADGIRMTTTPEGRRAFRFVTEDGGDGLLPVGDEFAGNGPTAKVKYVRAAILLALGDGGPDGSAARAFLRSLVLRQAAAGADYLDVNVDEVTDDPAGRRDAMTWLVRLLNTVAAIPLAIDSSDPEVIRAGLEASREHAGPPLLNSASIERRDILDLAAASGCPVVLSAAGATGLPSGVDDRVQNATAMIEAALALGIPVRDLFVDLLVVPVAVEPDAGRQFLDAVGRLRSAYGSELHLTGGLSNVSFGLPARRLVNDVFVRLAAEAGADSAIVDPLATDLDAVFARDRDDRGYRLAADMLTGADPYGMAFLAAFRAGEVGIARA